MQAVGQNDTGTGKSNHEPIWTRSYRGYSARRPSRDTARQKEGDETVAKWLISANIKLPWAYGYTTLPRCPLPIYQHFTEQPRRGRGKKKKKKKGQMPDGRGTASKGRIQQIQRDTILAPRADVWPTGINQVLPFSHPRPIDRSSGCLPGRHHIRTPPSTAPSSTHQPSGPLIGISTILPSLFVPSGAANQPTRRLVLFPWLWGERGETDWLWAWTGP